MDPISSGIRMTGTSTKDPLFSMCLQTKWKQPKVATKDMTVYKLLTPLGEKTAAPPYSDFPITYTLGRKRSTTMRKTSDNSSFDTEAMVALRKYDKGQYIGIGKGFHSALTKKRLIPHSSDVCVYKCTIPKGSLYYRGFTGLIVSNKIIILKQLK
jgi:hypothetical protein